MAVLQGLIFELLKIDRYDLLLAHAALLEPRTELLQKRRLPRAADARHDLDDRFILPCHQLFQIFFPLDHAASLLFLCSV